MQAASARLSQDQTGPAASTPDLRPGSTNSETPVALSSTTDGTVEDGPRGSKSSVRQVSPLAPSAFRGVDPMIVRQQDL